MTIAPSFRFAFSSWLLSAGVLMAAATNPQPAAQLSPQDQSAIQSAHTAWMHGAAPTSEGYLLRNPGQRWTARVDESGFVVQPQQGEWTWGLELISYGRLDGEWRSPELACLDAIGNRVTTDWGAGLTEWLLNDERGIEHGFTLERRPGGDGDWLRFDLQVRGNLRAEVFASGLGARFVDERARGVLTYSGLHVFDATGRPFPALITGGAGGIQILAQDSGAVYPLTIDPVAQQAYLKASNTNSSDWFGEAVAVSGNTVVVGASREDSSTTQVNGDDANNQANSAGAAYVFERQNGVWTQVAYLKASNAEANDGFGNAVAIDGDLIAVAADAEDGGGTGATGDPADNSVAGSGAVYVFERMPIGWTQVAYLKASNPDAGDQFGGSLAISGERIAVAALQEDSAAVGVDGNQLDNSANRAGAVYLFERAGGVWGQVAYLKASNTDPMDWFGVSLDLSGDTVAVGALDEESSAVGIDGNEADNSAVDAGAVYVFTRTNTGWQQEAYIKASNTDSRDGFGISLAIDGDLLVVGAFDEDSLSGGVNGNQADNSGFNPGAAYVFERVNGLWGQVAYLKARVIGDAARFGISVDVAGETVGVGSYRERSGAVGVGGNPQLPGPFFAGAAYLFGRENGAWRQTAYLKASNTAFGQEFGWSIALSDELAVIGAIGEGSGATGVNGDQSDLSAPESGAVYLFDRSAPVAAYCDVAAVNSTGQPGVLSSLGSVVVSENSFSLRADQLPASVFGYFLSSPGQDFVANPAGAQGSLCLGGGDLIGRHQQSLFSSGVGGFIEAPIDLTNIPTPNSPVAILAGEVWNFQCWYRDRNPGVVSNFTNGLSVRFE